MDDFESGKFVRLKSGGPIMTLGKKIGYDLWDCCWFNKKDEFFQCSLYEKVIELVDKKDKTEK